MIFSGDFSNLSGERLVQKLNSVLLWVKALIDAQRHDVTSGDLNRIPFYTSNEEVKDIQDNLDATGIELIALKDTAGTIDLWVISKTNSYPLKGIILNGGIISISGVTRDGSGNVSLQADSSSGLVITPDDQSKSILIDASALRSSLESAINANRQSTANNASSIASNQNDINTNKASITSNTSAIAGIQSTYIRDVRSPLGTISVSPPSTGVENIDVSPSETSQLLVSSKAGNTLTTASGGGEDGKLFVPTPPAGGVLSVTAGAPTITIAGTQADPTVAVNLTETSKDLLSSQSNNALVQGSDSKLYVPQSSSGGVQSVSAADNTISVSGTPADPSVAVTSGNLISAQSGNAITSGTDGKLFAPPSTAGSGVESINSIKQNNVDLVAGANVTITKTGTTGSESIQISSSGSGSVGSVTAGDATISIGGTATDPTVAVSPANTAASLISSTAGNALAQDGTDSKLFVPTVSGGVQTVSSGDSTVVIGGTSTAPTVSTSLSNMIDGQGGNVLTTGTNSKLYVPSSSADTPFVRDAVYFDDTYTGTSDGTTQKPWKTLQEAVNDASAKGVGTTKPPRVIAQGSATLVNAEDITIGSPATIIGLTLDLQYLTLTGSIKVDASATITEDTNFLNINVDKVERCKIEVINPQNLGSSTTKDAGITVRLNARAKVAENDEETFTCDASGLTTLKNNYISYVENIGELEEKSNVNTTNVRASIHFVLGANTVQSQFTAESAIQAIARDPSGATGSIPYIGFSNSVGLIDSSNITEIFIRDLKDNGQLYDMFSKEGASKDSILSADRIKSTYGEFDTVRVTQDLQAPVGVGSRGTVGSLYFNVATDKLYYINSKNQSIAVGGSSNGVGEEGIERFACMGTARTVDNLHEFRFPPMVSKTFDEGGIIQNHVMVIPSFRANFRVVDKTIGSNTFTKQSTLDFFNFTTEKFYGMGMLQIGGTSQGISFQIDTNAPAGTKQHTAAITFSSSDEAQIFINKIVAGGTLTFGKDATDKSCSCIVISASAGSDSKVINIVGYFNFDHAENSPSSDFKPLPLADANTEAFNKIWIGDNFAFDNSKKYFTSTEAGNAMGKEYVEVHYHPVLVQDEDNASNHAVFFVGFNPRFASGTTAGERSFSLKHLSKEYIGFFKSKFSGSNIAIQPLSLFIKGGVFNVTDSNSENGSRRIVSCDIEFEGSSYERIERFGLKEDSSITPHPASAYNLFYPLTSSDTTKTIPFSSSLQGTGIANNLPSTVASMYQDEVSVSNVDFIHFPELTQDNIAVLSKKEVVTWSYDPSGTGSPNLSINWSIFGTGSRVENFISLKDGITAELPNGLTIYPWIANTPEALTPWRTRGQCLLTSSELLNINKESITPPPAPVPTFRRVSRLSLLPDNKDILMD